MRIRLKEGKQKELIRKAKERYTWRKLSINLSLARDYIRNELFNEETFLSEKVYNKLKRLTNEKDWDQFITDKLDDNWGRAKGGKNSIKRIKKFMPIRESRELAEFVGIVLGDGHIEYRENHNYSVRIAGHLTEDYNFISVFLRNLVISLFNEQGHLQEARKYNTIWLVIHGKKFVSFLFSKGMQAGNKKTNNARIPKWIKTNDLYLKNCIRGLIDTDGSVHQISKKNKNIRINFTNGSAALLQDVKIGLNKLGYKTSKIIKERQIFITSKNDVRRYIKEIGFNNEKHLNRILKFQTRAPVV